MKPVLRFAAWLLSYAAIIAGAVGGIFAAGGTVAQVWGPGILETALGNHPDRTHPAFWVYLGLAIPGMVVGMAGMAAVVAVPLLYWTGARFGIGPRPDNATGDLKRYIRWLHALVEREEAAGRGSS
jgi:hypothetical protein